MIVKEIDRTANVAWSPSTLHPAYLAAGTPAQQLDATFSTSASLGLYTLDLMDSGVEMPLAGSIDTEERCCKVVWGSQSMGGDEGEVTGVIVTGTDKGNVCIYSPHRILQGKSGEKALLIKKSEHTGSVQALDFNPFQANLLATGAGESDIHIWDLNKMENPMTPGTKSQPADHVLSLAWNHKVQHILGSTFANRCVVWDLRKSDPVIKLSDSMTKMRCKQVCWHPEVATRLCLSSEDDHTPIIQVWDLRYAAAPVHSLHRHTKGILSMAWSPRDPDLLLSCAKDNFLFCWNPNSTGVPSGEVVYENRLDHAWAFDVAWCPRNPALVSAASFDGHVTLYSVMGGRGTVSGGPPKRVAESFADDPNDPFSQVAQAQIEAQAAATHHSDFSPALRKAPKWLKVPCRARFGFGGKLLSFTAPPPGSVPRSNSSSEDHEAAHSHSPLTVTISQVVTEAALVSKANLLDQVLMQSQGEEKEAVLREFCASRVGLAPPAGRWSISMEVAEMERHVWQFLKAHFAENTRSEFMELLGYGDDFVHKKIQTALKIGKESKEGQLGETVSLDGDLDSSRSGTDEKKEDEGTGEDDFDQIANTSANSLHAPDSEDGGLGGLGSQLQLSVEEDGVDSAISVALLAGRLDEAVDLLLRDDRAGEAVILAVASCRDDLYKKTRARVFSQLHTDSARLVQSVVQHDWVQLIDQCAIDNWREALAGALTYASGEEFGALCERLGERLEAERSGELALNACLCYICSANVDKLVACWTKNRPISTPEQLQSMMEMMMVLRKSVEDSESEGDAVPTCGMTSSSLCSRYAHILATQGCLETALHYLHQCPASTELVQLRERVTRAMSQPIQHNIHSAAPSKTTFNQPAYPVQNPTPTANTNYYNPPPQPERQRTISNSSSGRGVTSYPPTSSMYQPTSQYSVPPIPPPSGGMNQPGNYYQPAQVSTPPMPPMATSTAPTYSTRNRYPSANPNQPPANTYGGGYSPVTTPPYQPAQPSMVPPPPPGIGGSQPTSSYMPPPSAPHAHSGSLLKVNRSTTGWNDPPVVSQVYAHKKEETAPPVQPVNTFYNPAAFLPDPAQPPGAPPGGSYNPPSHFQPPPMGHHQPPPASHHANGDAPSVQTKQVQHQPQADLPDHYKRMQESLGALVNACRQANPSNRQMKMKMDDVDKKLATLYSHLSSGIALSPPVQHGLQEMTNGVQRGDYNSALAAVNAVIQQADFAEVRPFITGLKVLLQSAGKTLN